MTRILVVVLLLAQQNAWSWTGAHDEAARMAALLASAPFRDHPEWCAFAVYPDRLNDWGIAQSPHSRWAVWLLVREAVAALREGDLARGCVLTSIAAHFPQDAACMSHSVFFKMEDDPDSPMLLPSMVRPWIDLLPVARATFSIRRYGASRPEELVMQKGFFRADLAAPELLGPMYAATRGYSHDWLEGAAAALAMPPERRRNLTGAETVAGHPGWTLEDIFPEHYGKAAPPAVGPWYRRETPGVRSFYHRWLSSHYQGRYLLPFALFEQQSLAAGRPRFRSTAELKAVFAEEFRAGVEATTALYNYVAVAARTDVQSEGWEPGTEDLLADVTSIVLARDNEEWRRAADFAMQEIVLARARSSRRPADPVSIRTRGPYPPGSVIRFETSRSSRNFLRIGPRPGAAGSVEITLGASNPQAMGSLVDLMLDQVRAPLWSTAPPREAIEALKKIWAGMALVRSLRTRTLAPNEMVSYILPADRPIPFRNTGDDKQRFAELAQKTRVVGMEPWLRWLTEARNRDSQP